jgi:signal transduction histidine kinase
VSFPGNETHSDAPSAGAAAQVTAAGQPSAGNGQPVSGPAQGMPGPDFGESPAASAGQASAGAPPARRAGWRRLQNWHVRSKLLLLVAIPTLAVVVLAGVIIASSVSNYRAYQRVEQLAQLSGTVTTLAQQLQNERLDTVKFIVLATPDGRAAALASSPKVRAGAQPELQLLAHDNAITNRLASRVKQQAAGIGGSYPALVRQDAQGAIAAINGLPGLRIAATRTQMPATVAIQQYAGIINQLLALNAQIGSGVGDPALANTVRATGSLSAMKEAVSEQQAYLTSGLNSDLITKGNFGAGQLQAITAAEADQQSDQTAFNVAATAAQRQLLNNALSGSAVGLAQSQEQQAIALASSPNSLTADPTIANASSGASIIVQRIHSVEQQLVNSIIARSVSLRDDAIRTAIIFGVIVLLVLGLALLFTVAVGRSMIRPLHRLRHGALDVAGKQLPEAVQRISETEGEVEPQEIVPIDVDSTDEIGEVARAFDQVHTEAVRLASNEAALRGNVNAMFVNLSRRTQSLVQRQIHLIDDLEQGEQDSERLGSLFRLDHLATRMRRNSENLLVLAGHEASQRWSQPVTLVDVLRAAVSEIEQYERISLNVQPGISVRGQVVNDVVHLLAELLENATSFSSAESQVSVAGHLLNSGGVLLDVTDQGVGMPADEMKDANWRLDNPPVVDVAVSRRMGLFVVARLASRHGIRVRLRPGPAGGLTALIWLPDETVTYEAAEGPSGLQRLEASELLAGDYPLADGAGLGGSSREAAVAAARQPRFSPPGEEGEPETAGDEPGGDRELRPASGMPAVAPGNGAGGAQPPSGEIGQADAGQWDEVVVQDDSEARFGLAPRDSWGQALRRDDVTVPPAAGARDNRLPIFESVESDWFRRGRHEIITSGPDQAEPAYRPAEIGKGWSSPADEGWRAAEALESPSAAGLTPAGLPRRVPQANLVPGGVGEQQPAYQAAPTRSAATTRQRMASFQRGTREGRAALHGDESSGTESEEDA